MQLGVFDKSSVPKMGGQMIIESPDPALSKWGRKLSEQIILSVKIRIWLVNC